MGERSENNRDAADSRLFTSGGAIAKAELKIVNLKPGTGDDARIQFEFITLASYEPFIFAKTWRYVSKFTRTNCSCKTNCIPLSPKVGRSWHLDDGRGGTRHQGHRLARREPRASRGSPGKVSRQNKASSSFFKVQAEPHNSLARQK